MRHIPGKITKHKLADAIYLLVFETQYELASTFLRFQEHYESPKFTDKIFTLEQFMDWYAQEHKGNFSYFKDWSGFNVPSKTFKPFYEGKFDPLLDKEKRLMELFKDEEGRFYVIGIFSRHDLKHELAHALFATDKDYKTAALNLMKEFDTSKFEKEELAGYAKHVIPDEVQANLIATRGLSKKYKGLQKLQDKLRKLYHSHYDSAGIHLPKL